MAGGVRACGGGPAHEIPARARSSRLGQCARPRGRARVCLLAWGAMEGVGGRAGGGRRGDKASTLPAPNERRRKRWARAPLLLSPFSCPDNRASCAAGSLIGSAPLLCRGLARADEEKRGRARARGGGSGGWLESPSSVRASARRERARGIEQFQLEAERGGNLALVVCRCERHACVSGGRGDGGSCLPPARRRRVGPTLGPSVSASPRPEGAARSSSSS